MHPSTKLLFFVMDVCFVPEANSGLTPAQYIDKTVYIF